MSLSSMMMSVANDTMVSLVAPYADGAHGYVKFQGVAPGWETFDAYFHFQVHSSRGLPPQGQRSFVEGLIAAHLQKVLFLEGLEGKMELVKISWGDL